MYMRSKNLQRVLIDTWWNVNHKERSIEVSQVEVLIDTWWNVNRI